MHWIEGFLIYIRMAKGFTVCHFLLIKNGYWYLMCRQNRSLKEEQAAATTTRFFIYVSFHHDLLLLCVFFVVLDIASNSTLFYQFYNFVLKQHHCLSDGIFNLKQTKYLSNDTTISTKQKCTFVWILYLFTISMIEWFDLTYLWHVNLLKPGIILSLLMTL